MCDWRGNGQENKPKNKQTPQPELLSMAAMIAWQKGVKSAGVLDVMIPPSLTTASSTNVAPALMRSSLMATKAVVGCHGGLHGTRMW